MSLSRYCESVLKDMLPPPPHVDFEVPSTPGSISSTIITPSFIVYSLIDGMGPLSATRIAISATTIAKTGSLTVTADIAHTTHVSNTLGFASREEFDPRYLVHFELPTRDPATSNSLPHFTNVQCWNGSDWCASFIENWTSATTPTINPTTLSENFTMGRDRLVGDFVVVPFEGFKVHIVTLVSILITLVRS